MGRPSRKLILLTLAFLALGPATMADDEGELGVGTIAVKASGFRNRKGQVCVSLFDSKKSFPTDYTKALLLSSPAQQSPLWPYKTPQPTQGQIGYRHIVSILEVPLPATRPFYKDAA